MAKSFLRLLLLPSILPLACCLLPVTRLAFFIIIPVVLLPCRSTSSNNINNGGGGIASHSNYAAFTFNLFLQIRIYFKLNSRDRNKRLRSIRSRNFLFHNVIIITKRMKISISNNIKWLAHVEMILASFRCPRVASLENMCPGAVCRYKHIWELGGHKPTLNLVQSNVYCLARTVSLHSSTYVRTYNDSQSCLRYTRAAPPIHPITIYNICNNNSGFDCFWFNRKQWRQTLLICCQCNCERLSAE